MEVNYLAVFLAALSAFALGAIWYAPPVLGRKWQTLAGLSDDQLSRGKPLVTFGGGFVLSLIAAFVFAMFLGPNPGLGFALGAGFSAGLCWVAASLGINYLFEHKPIGLFAVNGGYHTLQFTLYGLVLGLMA
jgi:hypothetical protein